MAHVNFDGLNLRMTLERMERNAVHRKEVVIARANIAGVEHARDVWDRVRPQLTVMGIGYPGLLLIGIAETRGVRDFCILYRSGPGLVIQLREHLYDRVLLTMPDDQAWPLFARLREISGGPVSRPA